MTKTLTLTSKCAVPIQGNFASEAISPGTRYTIVRRTERSVETIAHVTAQKTLPFSTVVTLPPGSYTIGDATGVGGVYVLGHDGSAGTADASYILSTLNFIPEDKALVGAR